MDMPGPGKRFPGSGFEWDMSKDELKKNFPKAKQLIFVSL
jgi:hypothetical protein